MELETLFTISKWDILTHLSQGSFSPLELSKKTNTTIANISQQLRLLEFAGLVKKQKVSQREAGKPRTLYFLSDDFGYLVLVMKNCASKRLLHLSPHQKLIMRVWMIDNIASHYYIEKFLWRQENLAEQAKMILVDTRSHDYTIYVVADSKELKLQDVQIKGQGGETKNIAVKVFAEKDIGTAKLPREKLAELNVIHDPEGLLIKK